MLNKKEFAEIFPRCKHSEEITNAMISVFPKYGINTNKRIAAFLSQCGHESGGFRLTQENLNYSAKGLMGIFKKYFPTQGLADAYARKPEKIANKVYGNRMGNGPETSGEGFKFRGRGYIQLTGKENYTAFGKSIKVINDGCDLSLLQHDLGNPGAIGRMSRTPGEHPGVGVIPLQQRCGKRVHQN